MLEHFKISDDEAIRVPIDSLRTTTEELFLKCGVSEEDSKLGADVLMFADSRGIDTHGVTNDLRGYVYLWGGVVQKYRGYLRRNSPSPYNNVTGTVSIGYTKNYNYDANLDCTPPPFYPAIEFDNGTGEVNIRLADYKKVKNN